MLRLHGCCMGRKTGASPVLMLYTGACATLNLKIRLRYIACRILKTQVVAFRDRTTTFKRGSFELDYFQNVDLRLFLLRSNSRLEKKILFCAPIRYNGACSRPEVSNVARCHALILLK